MPDAEILNSIWRLVDEGSTPILGLISYFLWKMDKTLGEFIIELRAEKESRDSKIHAIHFDINAIIRKLAGLNGNSGND